MRIKSFVASSVQQALSDIKEEMGESSIILETRNIADDDIKATRGQSLVEIVAAEISEGNDCSESEEGGCKEEGVETRVDECFEECVESEESECFKEAVESELSKSFEVGVESESFGEIVESEVSENVYYHEGERPLSPEQKSGFPDDDWPEASKELFLMLCAQQVESEYARVIIVEMLSELNSESLENMIVQREKIREIITRKIKISYPKPLNERTNNPMVFIGASGIGKTTAMSKLAREARLYSGNEILLISIENDCVEKLNSIAREIGAAVAVVANPEELRTVHDEFKNSAHVFVETTVTRGNDNGKFQELMEYMKVIPDFESNLVLDATTRLKDISNIIAERKRVPVHGLLFTKIDEADTFGALLNVAMKSGIPVSYIAKGNRLSGGIKPATANMIAELIFNS